MTPVNDGKNVSDNTICKFWFFLTFL